MQSSKDDRDLVIDFIGEWRIKSNNVDTCWRRAIPNDRIETTLSSAPEDWSYVSIINEMIDVNDQSASVALHTIHQSLNAKLSAKSSLPTSLRAIRLWMIITARCTSIIFLKLCAGTEFLGAVENGLRSKRLGSIMERVQALSALSALAGLHVDERSHPFVILHNSLKRKDLPFGVSKGFRLAIQGRSTKIKISCFIW
jgi:hypothetical protein